MNMEKNQFYKTKSQKMWILTKEWLNQSIFTTIVLAWEKWRTSSSRKLTYYWNFNLILCFFFRVANDVKLLKNRVRMLQNEHDRAQKKIQQTTEKTV